MPTTSSDPERRPADEPQVFASPLHSLVRLPPVVCTEAASVDDAARTMQRHSVGSVVVVDARSRPIGIFTMQDLGRVYAEDLKAMPISAAMTRDPIALPGHAPAYEAALAMVERRVRHILVTQDGDLVGVVSERDLFSLQRLGLAELTMEIRLATDIDLLARLAAQIRTLTTLLVEQGVAAERLTLFVSVLNDRLSQRVIEVVRKRHRWEHVGWCWLAFGSEGRLEQTFSSDQDNGLVFESHEGTSIEATRRALLAFAREANEALDACGFALCTGNVMASNPDLCLSLDEWKAKMGGWFEKPDPKALLDGAICFDFRALHGDASLASALREWLLPRTRARPAFLRHLAATALEARPALGVIADFATEDAPNAPGTINLKLHGVRPFVDAARVFALAFGLAHTATVDRLRKAVPDLRMAPLEMAAIVDAFLFLQSLRLRIQARPGTYARESANRIDPKTLNAFEREGLKNALRQGRRLQRRLELDYGL
jgi:CBS domain-containing protein